MPPLHTVISTYAKLIIMREGRLLLISGPKSIAALVLVDWGKMKEKKSHYLQWVNSIPNEISRFRQLLIRLFARTTHTHTCTYIIVCTSILCKSIDKHTLKTNYREKPPFFFVSFHFGVSFQCNESNMKMHCRYSFDWLQAVQIPVERKRSRI